MSEQPQPPVQPSYASSTPSSGLAVAALVCGILGLVFCLPVGIAGLVMGIIALVRTNREPEKYGGKGMAIGGIVTGAISPITFITVISLFISILLPSIEQAREFAMRALCEANMRSTVTALAIYADSNNGDFPPGLNTLITSGDITSQQMVCPSAEVNNHVYVPGLNRDAPPHTVLIYEPIENHGDEGGMVGFVDGTVRFVTQPEYDELLAPYLGASP